MLEETVESGDVRSFADAEHTCNYARCRARVCVRCEVHEPDAAGPRADLPGGRFEGEAGLAGTTNPGQRDETVSPQESCDVVELVLAADETRQRRRKIVALQGRGRGSELLAEDGALERSQLLARVETEALGEERACAVIRRHRLCLALGVVEREHELAPQALAKRLVGDETLQLGDERSVTAERQAPHRFAPRERRAEARPADEPRPRRRHRRERPRTPGRATARVRLPDDPPRARQRRARVHRGLRGRAVRTATRRPPQLRCRARSREAVRRGCSHRATRAAERRTPGACLPRPAGARPARARRSAGRSRSPALARRGAGRGAIVAAGRPAGPAARRARLPLARVSGTRWAWLVEVVTLPILGRWRCARNTHAWLHHVGQRPQAASE